MRRVLVLVNGPDVAKDDKHLQAGSPHFVLFLDMNKLLFLLIGKIMAKVF